MIPTPPVKRDRVRENYTARAIPTSILRRDWGDGSLMSTLSRKCGIYFLLLDGHVTYIGRSTDIAFRVGTHYREVEDWKRKLVAIAAAEDGTHRKAERMESLSARIAIKQFNDVAYFCCPEDMADEIEAALLYLVRPLGGGPITPAQVTDDALRWLSNATNISYVGIFEEVQARNA